MAVVANFQKRLEEMITEDYVSFEVAKLLKKKGFDETCYACYEYFSSNITMYSGWPFEYKGEVVHNSNNVIKCPTLQMAMKWLREKHKIIISIAPTQEMDCKHLSYVATIQRILGKYELRFEEELYEDSYESACEDALVYCLTNLI